jgi:hypothetical protein
LEDQDVRRTVLLAGSLALAFAGVALAVSYKTGVYTAGSSSRDGVSLRIRHGSFSVSRISFRETCSNATDSFTDRFTFRKGSEAKLVGTINRRGRLSGRYESSAGTVKVTGSVAGSEATLNASETGTYTPTEGADPYTCRGSHTFHAKRLIVST